VLLALIIAIFVGAAYHERWLGLGAPRTVSGEGSVQILLDTHLSAFSTIQVPTTDQELDIRAPLYAEFGASSEATSIIAGTAGIPADELSTVADTSETTDSGQIQSTSYNSAPPSPATRYRVTLTASDQLPIITVSTHAPTALAARNLASASLAGLRLAAQRLEQSGATTTARQKTGGRTTRRRVLKPDAVELREVGPPVASEVVSSGSSSKAVEYAVVAFAVLLFGILALDAFLRRISHRREKEDVGEDISADE
jgi:hypothetical protein